MISYFANLIRYRFYIISFIIIITIFFLSFVSKVNISYTNKKPLPKDDQVFVNYQSSNNSFKSNENVLVLSYTDSLFVNNESFNDLVQDIFLLEGIDTIVNENSFNAYLLF